MSVSLGRDARQAFRILVRSGRTAVLAILSLSLGIAAVTVAWAFAHGILLSPLPYGDAGRLVTYWAFEPLRPLSVSARDFQYWKQESVQFQELAGYELRDQVWQQARSAQSLRVADVTGDFFTLLQVRAQRGRLIEPRDDEPEAEGVAVVSDAFWRGRLGAEEDVLGSVLILNGVSWTIVGVLDRGILMPGDPEVQVYRPFLRVNPQALSWPAGQLRTIARLSPGTDIQQATQWTDHLARLLAERQKRPTLAHRPRAIALLDSVLGDTASSVEALAVLSLLVLLIACANAGGLLLVQNNRRRDEYALRLSLGASRGRLLLLPFLQASYTAAAASALTLLGSHWVIPGIQSVLPRDTPRVQEVTLDWPVLAGIAAATLLAAAAAAVLPAFRSSTIRLNEFLKLHSGNRASTPGGGKLLLSAQVAVTATFLVVGLLTAKSFHRVKRADHGFDSRQVLTFRTDLKSIPHATDSAQFIRRILNELQRLPGVEGAAATHYLPLTGFPAPKGVSIEGVPAPRRGFYWADAIIVSPGFFEVLGTPLMRGRPFDWQEQAAANSGEVIVDQAFADRFWPGQDPLGKRIKEGTDDENAPWLTIVGVVPPIRYGELGEQRAEIFRGIGQGIQFFLPLRQARLVAVSFLVRWTGSQDPVQARRKPRPLPIALLTSF